MNAPSTPAALPVALARLIDSLCDRYEDAWKAGQSPRLEAFLSGVPDEACEPLVRELLRIDRTYLEQAGRLPVAEDYQERLGHLGPWIQSLLAELLPASPEFSVTLTVVEGPNQGDSFRFASHDTFLVGRSGEAHFSLPDDPYFSRVHFLIEVNPPACRLLDLKSHNKTYVNGQLRETADLAHGDRIKAGRTVFQVAIEQPAERTPAVPAPAESDTRSLDAPSAPAAPVMPAAVTTSALAGQKPDLPNIPGYRLERQLGTGGMGIVYLAYRLTDGSPVALKTIRPAVTPTDQAVARFLREAAILKDLDHPYIVAFRDQGRAGSLLYFVMDYVPGIDSGRIVEKHGPLPIGRAVRLLGFLLEALAYAHARGFVHRDVKPSNLLVTEANGTESAKLADFGLARTYQASQLSGLTMTGAVAGTPPFMPPEQLTNFRRVQPAADQYAAAATLYTLLTGQSVHGTANSPQELFQRILLNEPTRVQALRPEVPDALAAAIHRALARRPEDRFADVAAFGRALQAFAKG